MSINGHFHGKLRETHEFRGTKCSDPIQFHVTMRVSDSPTEVAVKPWSPPPHDQQTKQLLDSRPSTPRSPRICCRIWGNLVQTSWWKVLESYASISAKDRRCCWRWRCGWWGTRCLEQWMEMWKCTSPIGCFRKNLQEIMVLHGLTTLPKKSHQIIEVFTSIHKQIKWLKESWWIMMVFFSSDLTNYHGYRATLIRTCGPAPLVSPRRSWKMWTHDSASHRMS